MAATRSSMTSGCSARYSSPSASRSSKLMTQSPSVVPSNTTTLVIDGQLGVLLAQLGDLLVVLGEHDAAVGVGQDVGDVARPSSWGRPWWWRRRRPLIARSARIHSTRVPDAIATRSSALDAEGHEAGGQLRDPLAGLRPGQRLPDLVLVGIAVGLTRTAAAHPVEEHRRQARRTVLDDGELFGSDDWSRHLVILHTYVLTECGVDHPNLRAVTARESLRASPNRRRTNEVDARFSGQPRDQRTLGRERAEQELHRDLVVAVLDDLDGVACRDGPLLAAPGSTDPAASRS